jgi:hypothetical protein
VAGPYKHGNESSGFINGKFLDHRPTEATDKFHALLLRVIVLLPSAYFPTFYSCSVFV